MINQQHMMNRITTAFNFFVAGGTMRRHTPSYVKRPADDELLTQLLAGQFCYVLTSRQMGKSSLMVRTVQRLKAKQIKSVIIDLTAIGTVTVDQWYLGPYREKIELIRQPRGMVGRTGFFKRRTTLYQISASCRARRILWATGHLH